MRFDIDGICKWSYFFLDPDRDKLLRAARELAESGYEIVGFLEPSEDDENRTQIYVRLDRAEMHTVDSLLARNDELYAFADRLGLASYDGMDVGALDGP